MTGKLKSTHDKLDRLRYIVLVKTGYTIDKVNLTNAYCKYVKKFISCASVCELIFLLLILLAVYYNNFTAAIICCILFILVIIIQIIVFKKEFMRLKKIVMCFNFNPKILYVFLCFCILV